MSTINQVTETTTSLASKSISSQALGKEDFLQLLVAQLKNQDPLNPADATEFTAQLAQFSSLEQLFNVNKSLEGLATLSGDMERMSALNLIGRDVDVATNQFELDGNPVELAYNLATQAKEATVHILNASNQTVATLTGADTAAGEHRLVWDGRDNAGQPLPAGQYTLTVAALDQDDKTVTASTSLRSVVSGVDMSTGSSRVITPNGTYGMQKVAAVQGGS